MDGGVRRETRRSRGYGDFSSKIHPHISTIPSSPLLTQNKNICPQITPIYAEARGCICVNLRNLRIARAQIFDLFCSAMISVGKPDVLLTRPWACYLLCCWKGEKGE